MTISPDLFFAIVSLDSYNRGYDPGVVGLGGLLSEIGDVVLLTDSETLPETSGVGEAASFYAAAYQDSSGNIVISYRGTDDPLSDAFTGWVTGAGYLSAQARLAAEFYYQVQQANPEATITLTGHSLGGGLAGLMARLTGSTAYIFDNMPFELSAENAHEIATRTDAELVDASTFGLAGFSQAEYDRLYAERQEVIDVFFNGTVTSNLFNNPINAWQLPGEVLQDVRYSSGQITNVNDVGISSYLENRAAVVGSFLGAFPDISLHWVDPLIAKMFSDGLAADKAASNAWEPHLLAEWYQAYYSDDLAERVGFGADFKQMQKAISYSALETGLVFGNTGMRAMFNDLVPFGVVAGNGASLESVAAGQFDDTEKAQELRQALVNALVQLAGLMANRRVESGNSSQVQALDGILRFSSGGTLTQHDALLTEATDADAMYLDLSTARWSIGAQPATWSTRP